MDKTTVDAKINAAATMADMDAIDLNEVSLSIEFSPFLA